MLGGIYVLKLKKIKLNNGFFLFELCPDASRLLEGLADLRKKSPLSIFKTHNI